jgi:hypothetical protein
MVEEPRQGLRIARAMQNLADRGFEVGLATEIDTATYTVAGAMFTLTVIVKPQSWLGLVLGVTAWPGSSSVTYEVDTDLYDISNPKNASFGSDIEGEIVSVIDGLGSGSIKVGRLRNKNSVIIPSGEYSVVITAGRFVTSIDRRSRLSGDSLVDASVLT